MNGLKLTEESKNNPAISHHSSIAPRNEPPDETMILDDMEVVEIVMTSPVTVTSALAKPKEITSSIHDEPSGWLLGERDEQISRIA